MADRGSANLSLRAAPILDAMVSTLRRHVEIETLEIRGYRQPEGPSREPAGLAMARARAVERHFVEHGIDRARLDVRALPDDPGFVGTTAAVAARNRRVDFAITRPALGNAQDRVRPHRTVCTPFGALGACSRL